MFTVILWHKIGDGSRTYGARSVTAIVIQLTIELLMGIDLFLLGLILCLVALPLEAACWWRWRLSRMDADAALTLARALSSFRDYVSVR